MDSTSRPEPPPPPPGEPVEDREGYYRTILNVSGSASETEVRIAYRNQLGKYHPDKVNHLGEEFYDLASRRTREIIEAYEFLKNKHHYK